MLVEIVEIEKCKEKIGFKSGNLRELMMIFQLAVILEGASHIILNSVVCCNSIPFSSTEDCWSAAVNVYSCCSTSLSAFVVICILDFGHSNRKLSNCIGDPGLPRGFHKVHQWRRSQARDSLFHLTPAMDGIWTVDANDFIKKHLLHICFFLIAGICFYQVTSLTTLVIVFHINS
ncbi:uncharacterized protein LOC129659044 isoform X10 [Bubalus kerabau]|uniref:uncharacterized protein LOC129659044 isoform X10 n=1 Tax=Bubalus carabanensis TaxID=3119969 RepID=UPI00244EBA6F|nr:uncharacterized protein LOC129659044 isoform X10 [Bubalus carabanensis]